MINIILKILAFFWPLRPVFAHCDIPCGIYDPHTAQLAAHTVLRMTQLIMTSKINNTQQSIHDISRFTKVKEEHAEIVKQEIRVLWGDYFKEEHLKEYPHLHDLVFKTLKLASKARQEINEDAAKDLLLHVQQIAEIFYKTKGLTPYRVASYYPTGLEIVQYK